MVIEWEKELLLLESIRKKPTLDADVVVAVPTMSAIKHVLHVDLVEVKRLRDINGRIRK